MFGCYIKERERGKKKKKTWEMGEGCELWGGNERKKRDGGCVCMVGEKKKER